MAEQSKTKVCGRSLAEIAVSNPAGGVGVCVVCVLYSKDKRQSQDKAVQTKYGEGTKKIRQGARVLFSKTSRPQMPSFYLSSAKVIDSRKMGEVYGICYDIISL